MRRRTDSADEHACCGRVQRVALRVHWHLVGVIALGVACTGSVWGLFKQRERQLLHSELAARAKERVVAIGRELRDDVDLLYVAAAFIAQFNDLDREEFLTYVGSLTSRAKSVQAIEWVPRVTLDQRARFERRLREASSATAYESATGIVEANEGGQVTAAGVRDVYYPVEYVSQPGGVRTETVGFDHASHPPRWQAMEQAVAKGEAVATERLLLFDDAQPESDRYGILVAMPVFARGKAIDTPAARHEALIGFVFGVYRLSDIVSRALADFSDLEVNCRVLDVTEPGRRDELHLNLARSSGRGGAEENLETLKSGFIYAAQVDVPGRKWVVECWPTPLFMQAHMSILPTASLITGLIGTVMVALLVWVVDGRADAVERTVVERTAELQHANAELEAEVRERIAAQTQLAEHARNLEETNRQLEQVRAALQQQATIDSLTGIMNRHSFSERLAGEWSRACRQDVPLSCILLDVDFFKKINDTYGHFAGDDVLKSLTLLLRDHTRDYDCVARYGGEEFSFLLPNANEDEAIEWAERLRQTIASHPLSGGNRAFPITVSIGVTSRTPDVKGPEDLLNQADEAMLVAKRQGRNRVVAFSHFHRLATDSLESGGNFFHGACAADIMTPVLVHLTPLQPLEEAAQLLLSLRLDSVPVIDEEGRTLGIIGEEDLTAQILSDRGWHQSVGDVMNTAPVMYDARTPAADICDFLSRVTVRRVIILHAGRPVGLISRSTLIRWLHNSLLADPAEPLASAEFVAAADDVADRLRSTIDRLSNQIAALQQSVHSSQGAATPVIVSAATRIQELVDDALMLSADQNTDHTGGYATMGAVLS